mgnify:CR=1 FL=1
MENIIIAVGIVVSSFCLGYMVRLCQEIREFDKKIEKR